MLPQAEQGSALPLCMPSSNTGVSDKKQTFWKLPNRSPFAIAFRIHSFVAMQTRAASQQRPGAAKSAPHGRSSLWHHARINDSTDQFIRA